MTDSIVVENVNKSFRLFHQKRSSLFDLITRSFSQDAYEKLDVLKEISFKVQKGEILGIIGSNGSGKTTLLRLMSGIYAPDSGTIRIDGTLIPLLELGIGFHPDLTALENIVMYGVILGLSKGEITKRIDGIIEFAELEKFKDTSIRNFSSGMFARLAFSTAIQVDPDILLLDEVLSVGDAHFQRKCFDKLLDFKQRNKTIVLVTHSIDSVSTFCDKALLLHQGKVHAYGEPIEVLRKYKQIQD